MGQIASLPTAFVACIGNLIGNTAKDLDHRSGPPADHLTSFIGMLTKNLVTLTGNLIVPTDTFLMKRNGALNRPIDVRRNLCHQPPLDIRYIMCINQKMTCGGSLNPETAIVPGSDIRLFILSFELQVTGRKKIVREK